MSSAPFPTQIDASKLFARNGVIDAVLPLNQFQRLAEYLTDSEGQVLVSVSFGHDEQGRRQLTGSLSSTVQLACQRCLQPRAFEQNCQFALVLLESEEELEALSEAEAMALEAIVLQDSELDVQALMALLEDELILSIPLVPMHEDEHCNSMLDTLQSSAQSLHEAQKQNPFAALAGLKKGQSKATDEEK